MHFVKCKMLTIFGKFSKIQERFKIKTSEYNHGKRRAAGKIGENINCFLLNEKYMLFGGKIKMKQYDEALKKETAFLGQPRGGGDSQFCTALFIFFKLRNECRNDLLPVCKCTCRSWIR